MPQRVLILDGHPDRGRLLTHLLDTYAADLPAGTEVARIAIRDLAFDPIFLGDYDAADTLAPDLERAFQAIMLADHVVIGFPLWWGAEPALLKGFLDRTLLPGRAFAEPEDGGMPKGLLGPRTAELIVTMATPPMLMRTLLGDPLARRMKTSVLGFCGFRSIRSSYFGGIAPGTVAGQLAGWHRRLRCLAARLPCDRRIA